MPHQLFELVSAKTLFRFRLQGNLYLNSTRKISFLSSLFLFMAELFVLLYSLFSYSVEIVSFKILHHCIYPIICLPEFFKFSLNSLWSVPFPLGTAVLQPLSYHSPLLLGSFPSILIHSKSGEDKKNDENPQPCQKKSQKKVTYHFALCMRYRGNPDTGKQQRRFHCRLLL